MAHGRGGPAPGVERFVFFSALGASTHHRTRLLRAKALAEQAVREAALESIVFAPSIVYAPGDPWLTLLERMALAPVMPVSGGGHAMFQPIWAEDVADCVIASLGGSGEAPAATSWPDRRLSATRRSCAPCCARWDGVGPW